MSDPISSSDALRPVPLQALHVEAGARMGPFAGFNMPVQYPQGILQEHLHTRAHAGLFDVSHMGQIDVLGEQAAVWLESVIPGNFIGLAPGRQTYALLPNEAGGIIDDLMIQRIGSQFCIVSNASRFPAVLDWLRARLPAGVALRLREDLGLLALQGPEAQPVLERLIPGVAALRFLDVAEFACDGARCRVSRSGYTGEDGFEISVPVAGLASVARFLSTQPEVQWIGLGARDTLRLEAGLPLYGNDIDAHTSPVAAGLGWAIAKVRRPGGERAGGYPGAAAIEAALAGGTERLRVGLLPQGRAPLRAGVLLFDAQGQGVGHISSGGFSPSLNRPIAMGYVARALAVPGTALQAQVRGQMQPLQIVPLPFVPHNYVRKTA